MRQVDDARRRHGREAPCRCREYRTIERPHLLVFTWLPDWQEDATETIVRWDLEEKDGVTTVRLTHSGFTTEASRATYRGWPQILGGLQSYVEQQV